MAPPGFGAAARGLGAAAGFGAAVTGFGAAVAGFGVDAAGLAAARGAVVPRERIQALLPGTSTDGHAVEAAIARLRDSCGSKDIVRTVVKRGYALGLAPAS